MSDICPDIAELTNFEHLMQLNRRTFLRPPPENIFFRPAANRYRPVTNRDRSATNRDPPAANRVCVRG